MIVNMTEAPSLVRAAREDMGMTQAALAKAAGLKQPNIAQIESGSRPVSAELLEKILTAADYRPSLALERHASQLVELGKNHGITNIRVFGSVARGQDHHSSDVDLLVDVDRGRSYFDVGAFQVEAQRLLGFPVDVVVDSGDRDGMDHVRATAVPV